MSNQPPNKRLQLLSEATANANGAAKEWTGKNNTTF